MKLDKSLKNISYHIACIVILMNILQFGLGGLGISFNMFYLEYFLIFILLVIKKIKVKNFYNVLILFIVMFTFLINTVLVNNNATLNYYIQEFIYYALPLVIIFLFEYDYQKLSDIFFKYCFLTILLYLVNLILNNSILNDYMTFGYGGIFAVTYVAIYSIFNKKMMSLVFSIISGVAIFAYGSRGGILVLLTGLTISSLSYIKNKLKKWMLIFLLLTILIFHASIINFSVNKLTDLFGNDLYVIRQLNNMLTKDDSSELLGGRYYIYQEGIYEIKQNFITGMGIGGFQEKYGYFVHNIFLDVYSTFGIFLGTFYFIFLLIIIKKALFVANQNKSFKIFFLFSIAIITKLLLSKTFIYDSYIWLMISIFLNAICVFPQKKRVDGIYDNSIHTYIQ